MGLRTWDKPAAACLASRIPYGTEVSVEILGRVDRAEAALHRLGFAQVRVRHYDDTARIEVDLDDSPQVIDAREAIVSARPQGRLSLRDRRSRRVPLRQPQRLTGARSNACDAVRLQPPSRRRT